MNNLRIQVIRTAIVALIFLIAGWFIAEPVFIFLFHYYQKKAVQVQFVTDNIKGQFNARLFTAFSIALLPVFALCFSLLLDRLKGFSHGLWGRFLVFLVTGYFIGILVRMWAIGWALSFSISKNVVSTVNVEKIYPGGWALTFALIVTGIPWLVAYVRVKSKSPALKAD